VLIRAALQSQYTSGGSTLPTTEVQLQITNSQFKNVYFDCDGGLAYISLNNQFASISGTYASSGITFFNINGRYNGGGASATVGKGGVFFVNTMKKLTISNIHAEEFKMKQTTDTNGGGRFLYFERTTDISTFDLTITGSTF
jgi:hypothetical protein